MMTDTSGAGITYPSGAYEFSVLFILFLCCALSTIVCGFVFFDISLYVIIQFTADDYPMWILQILLIAYSTYYIRKR
jgi:hypothetical protein